MNVTVLGAGSWGATLAIHLCKNNHDVTMWEFNPEQAERLISDRENKIFLPGIAIPEEMSITSELQGAVSDAEVIVFAVPSHFVRDTAKQISTSWNNSGKVVGVVSVSKGLEIGSQKRMSEILLEELSGSSEDLICTLSGPSHAEEVSRNIATAIVAASKSIETAKIIQQVFFSPTLRVYASEDIAGVELGGSLKNTIAIAAGICDGAGFGDNTKAALMTRGLVEMTRMAVKLGAKPDTFSGLAGMGDMIVTCLSRHSRNRHVGEEIGTGKTLDEVLGNMTMVAEGVKTTKAIRELSIKFGIPMPISEEVYQVLFENKSPHQAVEDLMSRDMKVE